MEKKILIVSSIASVLFFSWGIGSWKFSFVGDEWAFFIKALEIINLHFRVNPLSMQGVYLENPLLGSVWQALFMRAFGETNFAWRLSNTILILPSSIMFYLFLKKLVDSKVALFGTIFMQWSFYLSNYFKLGVVNPQAVALFIGCLYLGDLASRTNRWLFYVLTGLVLGISFYLYIGPIYVALIWPFFLRALKTPLTKLIPRVGLMFVVMFTVISPGLFDATHWQAAAKKTIFVREFTDQSQILVNVYHNFFLFYKNYDYMFNHFISGPYLDTLTQVLATFGILVCLFRIKKISYLSILLGYVSMAVVLGITSPYSYAPTSRGVFLLPYGFIFAAIGLEVFLHDREFKSVVWLIVLTIISLNIYRSQVEYFEKYGLKHSALILKFLLEHPTENTLLYLSGSEEMSYNYSNLYPMTKAFKLSRDALQVVESPIYPCNVFPDHVLVLDQDKQAQMNLSYSYCKPNKITIIYSKFGPY